MLPSFSWVLLGFTKFYWVSLGFAEFHDVLLDFIRFLLGFTEFYRVLPGFTGFCGGSALDGLEDSRDSTGDAISHGRRLFSRCIFHLYLAGPAPAIRSLKATRTGVQFQGILLWVHSIVSYWIENCFSFPVGTNQTEEKSRQ